MLPVFNWTKLLNACLAHMLLTILLKESHGKEYIHTFAERLEWKIIFKRSNKPISRVLASRPVRFYAPQTDLSKIPSMYNLTDFISHNPTELALAKLAAETAAAVVVVVDTSMDDTSFSKSQLEQ